MRFTSLKNFPLVAGSSRVDNSVKSLREASFSVVSQNILRYRNSSPEHFTTLEPILKKLRIGKLQQFLAYNPDLSHQCDHLFSIFCYAEFKHLQALSFENIVKQLKKSKFYQVHKDIFDNFNESWAQLYTLLHEEQKYRLQQINDSIQKSNSTKKEHVRKAVVIDASHGELSSPGKVQISTVSSSTSKQYVPKVKQVSGNMKKASVPLVQVKPKAPLMRKCLNIKKRYSDILK